MRRTIKAMVEDVVAESRERLTALKPASADDVRHAGRAVVGFSAAMAGREEAIKARLKRDVYRHADVMAVMSRAEAVVRRLFRHYRDDPLTLPESWRPAPGEDSARVIADFLAGMTDRYALREYERFAGPADIRGI